MLIIYTEFFELIDFFISAMIPSSSDNNWIFELNYLIFLIPLNSMMSKSSSGSSRMLELNSLIFSISLISAMNESSIDISWMFQLNSWTSLIFIMNDNSSSSVEYLSWFPWILFFQIVEVSRVRRSITTVYSATSKGCMCIWVCPPEIASSFGEFFRFWWNC